MPPAISRRLSSTATSAIATAAPHSSTRLAWNAVRRTVIVDVAVAQADLADPVRLLAAAPERPERRDPAAACPRSSPASSAGRRRARRSPGRPGAPISAEQRDEHGPGRPAAPAPVGGSMTSTTTRTTTGTTFASSGRRPERAHPGLDGLEAVDERRGDLAAPLAARRTSDRARAGARSSRSRGPPTRCTAARPASASPTAEQRRAHGDERDQGDEQRRRRPPAASPAPSPR